MSSLKLLSLDTKYKDGVRCSKCGEGILIPQNPKSEINHYFYCNKCDAKIHLEANVEIE